MSRGNFKITRDYSEVDREPNQRVTWLDRFAESYADGKTAVEVARERMEVIPLHEQIQSIMNGGPTHRTVEDAVQDYQERTGLLDYLKQAKASQEVEEAAAIIKGGRFYQLDGDNLADIDDDSVGDDDAASEKKKSPTKENLIETLQKLIDKLEEPEKEEKGEEKEDEEEEVPEIIQAVSEIGQFIENVIENNPGIHYPAVVQLIAETFGRDISPSQLDDPVLIRYIDKRRRPAEGSRYNANLGRGLGTQRNTDLFGDLQNNDPFSFARPSSRY